MTTETEQKEQIDQVNVDLKKEKAAEPAIEEKTLEDAADLIAAGTQALAASNYEEAAEKLALAVEIQVNLLGQYSLEVAPSFHLYGKALLQAAVQKNSVLGEKADQIKPVEQTPSTIHFM
jgi:hypothetical protein